MIGRSMTLSYTVSIEIKLYIEIDTHQLLVRVRSRLQTEVLVMDRAWANFWRRPVGLVRWSAHGNVTRVGKSGRQA